MPARTGLGIEQRADVHPFDRTVPGRNPARHFDTDLAASGGPEPGAHLGRRVGGEQQGLVDAQLAVERVSPYTASCRANSSSA